MTDKKAVLLEKDASLDAVINKVNQNATDVATLMNRDESRKDELVKHDIDQIGYLHDMEERLKEHTTLTSENGNLPLIKKVDELQDEVVTMKDRLTKVENKDADKALEQKNKIVETIVNVFKKVFLEKPLETAIFFLLILIYTALFLQK